MASTRKLTLPNGNTIHYQLERRGRRTIGLKISSEGLTVHAPRLLLVRQIESLLKAKSGWIQQKLEKQQAQYIPPIEWQDKTKLLFLGNEVHLHVENSARNQQAKLANNTLLLKLNDSSAETIQRKTLQWYQKQALPDFEKRIRLFAAKLGVPTPPIKLSNAKTRWGSCNSRGEIRLSWRLIQAPPAMINYVVCHELAHLKEMNHSPRFYAVLAGLMPEHRHVEKALDQFSRQLHRL